MLRSSQSLTIVARVELTVGIHAHVERRIPGVGEAALARVDLHRGHPEVEVDHVGLEAFVAQLREALGEVARMKRVSHGSSAASSAKCCSATGSRSIAISVPPGPEPVGDQPRVAAGAERAVDRRLTALRVEELDQLAGEDGDVTAVIVNQDGQDAQ